MNIPHTIAGLRKAGLTQTEIGVAIGRNQTSVSDMETGKSGIKRPSADVVKGLTKLAKKHHVPMEPPSP